MSVKATSNIKLIYAFNLKYDLGFYNSMADLRLKKTNLKFYVTLYELNSCFTATVTPVIVDTDIKV
jgi:hypothetical protein